MHNRLIRQRSLSCSSPPPNLRPLVDNHAQQRRQLRSVRHFFHIQKSKPMQPDWDRRRSTKRVLDPLLLSWERNAPDRRPADTDLSDQRPADLSDC